MAKRPRSRRAELSDEDLAEVLKALGHPNRLPILTALEARPMSAAELAQELGRPEVEIRNAIKALTGRGLAVLKQVTANASGPDNSRTYIYTTAHRGWSSLAEAVESVLATRYDDT